MYDLQGLQLKEIKILQAVHEACEALGLKYMTMYGTLLGAVRHQGFIPWDDDIDICMPREDYDIFIEKGHEYLPQNIKIQHYTTEADCPNLFAKVRDEDTTFLQQEHIDLDINHGIFIDIIPLEKIKAKKWLIEVEYVRRKAFNVLNGCYDEAYVKGLVRPISKGIGVFIHNVIDVIIVRPTRQVFIQREDVRRKKLHNCGDDCTFADPFGKSTVPYSWFAERQLYQFNGNHFYGPKNYDRILSRIYGNYMQLPPEDKRIAHKPLFVDLNRGYTREEIHTAGIVKRSCNCK